MLKATCIKTFLTLATVMAGISMVGSVMAGESDSKLDGSMSQAEKLARKNKNSVKTQTDARAPSGQDSTRAKEVSGPPKKYIDPSNLGE